MKRFTICLSLVAAIALLTFICHTSIGAGKKSQAQPTTKPARPHTQRKRVTGPADKPTSYYEKRELRGWTLRINKDLLKAENAELLSKTLAELGNHFYRIEQVIPAEALAHLKKVVIWIELDNPKGRNCCYHPSVDWLKANNYNPDKAKCIEIGSASYFLKAARWQPWMILHELAHAYHDQVLDFDNPKVMACYEAAKKSGKYDKVLIWNGHVGKHYAMTNQKEYFAEDTEAYFGTNDIFPFVKAELRRHDPNMYDLLGELWGVTQSGKSK